MKYLFLIFIFAFISCNQTKEVPTPKVSKSVLHEKEAGSSEDCDDKVEDIQEKSIEEIATLGNSAGCTLEE